MVIAFVNDMSMICDPILVVHNNLEQTLSFKHSLFGHFIKDTNEIWYLGGALTGLPRCH